MVITSKTIIAPTVEYDENTLLLLHSDSFMDASMYGREVTNHNVSVSDEQSVFGGKSLYFDGSSARLEIENLLKGNEPFTIEMWAYPLSVKNNTLWSHGGTNISAVTGGGVEMYGDSSFIYYCSGFWVHAGSYVTNQWYHVALVGEQTSIKLYVNGVLIGAYNGAYNFGDFIEDIGANASAYGGENFLGYLDEIRISNVARWTENFMPPTEAYRG